MAEIPPPPPGFTLDAPVADVPPPPPGFTLDQPAAQSEVQAEPETIESVVPAPVAEGASALNRGFAAIPDFFIDAANSAQNLIVENARSVGFPIPEVPQIPRLQQTLEAATDGDFGAENFMEPGLARTVIQEGGEFIPGAAAGFTQAPKAAAQITQGLADDAATAAATTAGRLRTGDTRAVGEAIGEAGEVIADPNAREALKQGFQDATVTTIKAASDKTKEGMRRMVSILEKGRRNPSFADKNRPADVIGDALSERLTKLNKVNKQAGKSIAKEAERLSGKPVDLDNAAVSFTDELANLGVSVGDDLTVSLKGSSIENLPGAKKSIELMLNRLQAANGNALTAHRFKKFIDNAVFSGAQVGSKKPLTRDIENTFKGLRRSIDQALDSAYPAYKSANDDFSQTKQVLDSVQKLAGRTIDLNSPNANKQLGTLSRRLFSNAASRVAVMDGIDGLSEVSAKFGLDTSDDIFALARLADELGTKFKSVAPQTTLQGEVLKAGQEAVEQGVTRTLLGTATKGAVDKLRNIGDEQAIKSLKDLLNPG